MGRSIWSKNLFNSYQKFQNFQLLKRPQHTSSLPASASVQRFKPVNGLSYLSVPGEQPLLGLTLGQLFDEAVKKHGDREGLFSKYQGIKRSFAELQAESENLAEGFLEVGLQKGDRIGIWGPNSHEWYLTQVAAAKAGLVLVNVNPAYEGPEVLYALNKVGVRGIVIAEEFKGRNFYDTFSSVIPSIQSSEPGRIKGSEAPSLSTLISMSNQSLKGAYSFNEVLNLGHRRKDKKRLAQIGASIQFDDIFNIQFTSGTTGKPKGVMLSHHNMVNNSYLTRKRLNATSEDRLCVPVPFFHCYGGVAACLMGLHAGASSVLPSPGFEPKKAIEVVQEEKCTLLYGTPTMHVDMINVVKNGSEVASLRIAVTAGSICTVDLARKIRKIYEAEIVSYYGLTETSPVFYQTLPEDPEHIRVSTVGYPQEHTEVKLVDADGRIVPLGLEGEMCARGYCTMLGYWKDPEKTAEVLKDSGWFHTGDVFVMDESGHARIVGRTKEMIIRGGENIYPREIEEFLHSHPKVTEAYVFGLPHDRLGEEVAVWIRVKDGDSLSEDELRSYSKGKIASYKIPKHIFFRSDFPKTASGKVQKFLMRKETMNLLGLK